MISALQEKNPRMRTKLQHNNNDQRLRVLWASGSSAILLLVDSVVHTIFGAPTVQSSSRSAIQIYSIYRIY